MYWNTQVPLNCCVLPGTNRVSLVHADTDPNQPGLIFHFNDPQQLVPAIRQMIHLHKQSLPLSIINSDYSIMIHQDRLPELIWLYYNYALKLHQYHVLWYRRLFSRPASIPDETTSFYALVTTKE